MCLSGASEPRPAQTEILLRQETKHCEADCQITQNCKLSMCLCGIRPEAVLDHVSVSRDSHRQPEVVQLVGMRRGLASLDNF